MDKKKRIISIVIILLLLVGLFVILYLDRNDLVVNNNEGVVKERLVNDILFYDIVYTYDKEKTNVKMNIKNNNDKSVKIGVFTVKAKDIDGNIINTFVPVCNDVIESGGEGKVEFFIKDDISSAYSIEIELPNLEFLD